MGLLNTAGQVVFNGTEASAVFRGSTQVWPSLILPIPQTWRLSDFAGSVVTGLTDADVGDVVNFAAAWDGTELVITYSIPPIETNPMDPHGLMSAMIYVLSPDSDLTSTWPHPDQQDRSQFTGLMYTADIDFSGSKLTGTSDVSIGVIWDEGGDSYLDFWVYGFLAVPDEISGGAFQTVWRPSTDTAGAFTPSDNIKDAMNPHQSDPAGLAITLPLSGPVPNGNWLVRVAMPGRRGAFEAGATTGVIRIRDITWVRTEEYIDPNPQFPRVAMRVAPVPVAHDRVEVQWTDMVAAGASDAGTYTVSRAEVTGIFGLHVGPYTELAAGLTAATYTDTTVQPETHYRYKVQFTSLHNPSTATGDAVTPAVPPPPPPPTPEVPNPPQQVQKFVEIEATRSISVNGSDQNRNVAQCYYGYYGSNNGNQKSQWYWPIPDDVRNCVSIDRIDVRVYNIHAFLNSGGTTGLVVHHNPVPGGYGATWPGCTEILTHMGSQWLIGTPKPGYMTQDGSGWMTNIHVLSAPGRTTLAEEFRVNGAQGMGLVAPNADQSHYGYAAGADAPSGQKPAIRIWYTVNV
jgi:hypothetical protein